MENLREKKERSLVVGLIALIVIIVVLALIGLFLLKPEPQIIQGQAEATQVRVSGKLPGRVVEFMVEEGQHVKAGDTLVHIHSSLVEAKLSQAEAMASVPKPEQEGRQRHPHRVAQLGLRHVATGSGRAHDSQEDLRPHGVAL